VTMVTKATNAVCLRRSDGRRDQRCLGWCVDVWVLIRLPLNSALVAFPHTAVASLARLDVFGYPSADERS